MIHKKLASISSTKKTANILAKFIFHQPRFPWNSRGPISLNQTATFWGYIGRVFGRERSMKKAAGPERLFRGCVGDGILHSYMAIKIYTYIILISLYIGDGKPGYLLYIGDEKLPNYMGIII